MKFDVVSKLHRVCLDVDEFELDVFHVLLFYEQISLNLCFHVLDFSVHFIYHLIQLEQTNHLLLHLFELRLQNSNLRFVRLSYLIVLVHFVNYTLHSFIN
jgi:hypothetical protein